MSKHNFPYKLIHRQYIHNTFSHADIKTQTAETKIFFSSTRKRNTKNERKCEVIPTKWVELDDGCMTRIRWQQEEVGEREDEWMSEVRKCGKKQNESQMSNWSG